MQIDRTPETTASATSQEHQGPERFKNLSKYIWLSAADFGQHEGPDDGSVNILRTNSICIRDQVQQEMSKSASVSLLVQSLTRL